MKPTVAFAGNPNTGKTSLFNATTGARREVGNWPGQTVETHRRTITAAGLEAEAVDLPGVYGLLPVSAEETIAIERLVERPDVVVTVVDSANLVSHSSSSHPTKSSKDL